SPDLTRLDGSEHSRSGVNETYAYAVSLSLSTAQHKKAFNVGVVASIVHSAHDDCNERSKILNYPNVLRRSVAMSSVVTGCSRIQTRPKYQHCITYVNLK
ncbi:hypothetical protein L9F63_021578, partial [Diploptera punctata]